MANRPTLTIDFDFDGEFTLPPFLVWLDFETTGAELGTEENPYRVLQDALDGVNSGGTLKIVAGQTSDSATISKAIVIDAVGGAVSIGSAERASHKRTGFVSKPIEE